MKRGHGLWLVVCLAFGFVVSAPVPVRACGGGLVTMAGQVAGDAQRIFISVHGGMTDVITEVGVPNTAADYGVLIPLPARPTLDPNPADMSELARLYAQTAPSISHAAASGDEGVACACGGASKASNAGSGGRAQVGEPVAIGPVVAVVLDATSGDAVNGWLTDNNFAIPADGQSIVAAYSGAGRYFIALRRSDSAATGAGTAVGVHFSVPGDARVLPLGFARLGAAPTVAFTLLLAGDATVGPALPFEAITLDDLDAGLLRQSLYAQAVQSAVAAHNNRAFVIEGSWTSAEFSVASTSTLKALLPDGQILTRLSTTLPAAALSGDVAFDAPFTGPAPRQRIVELRRTPRRWPAGWGIGLTAVALVFARRRPARS